LHKRQEELGLGKRVTFTGPKNIDEVRNLMRAATVFCLPCTVAPDRNQDALPTSLLEAMACGLPVVSTTVSGVPEIVDSGTDGVLVPPDDADSLSRALMDLLSSPEKRAGLAAQGRQKALHKFDLRNNVGSLLEVFSTESGCAASTAETSALGRSPRPRDAAGGGRVLYLCADRGIPFGGTKGASIHVREFVDALRRAGHEVSVVVARREEGDPPGFPLHVLADDLSATLLEELRSSDVDGTLLTELRDFRRNQAVEETLADIFEKTPFDVIYERYSLFGAGGLSFARKAGVPFVLEVNAPLVLEAARYRGLRQVEMARAVERHLFASADRVTAVSASVRDYVLGAAARARVTVVPNGVNLERFDAAAGEEWRSRLTRRPDQDFLVGFVGTVRAWHGVDALIDAVGRLATADPTLSLCIVGNIGELRNELAQQSRSTGLDGRVTFAGPVPPAAIPDVLRSMDVLVAPYPEIDGFYFSPLKVFEYMASGRPIVASAIGQITEVLADESTALLVGPGDIEALAAAIRRLRTQPELRERLGQNAAAEARNHSWQERVQRVTAIFDHLPVGRKGAA
jgi:glycosyltransferase involved in cell wall biosynthesis